MKILKKRDTLKLSEQVEKYCGILLRIIEHFLLTATAAQVLRRVSNKKHYKGTDKFSEHFYVICALNVEVEETFQNSQTVHTRKRLWDSPPTTLSKHLTTICRTGGHSNKCVILITAESAAGLSWAEPDLC